MENGLYQNPLEWEELKYRAKNSIVYVGLYKEYYEK